MLEPSSQKSSYRELSPKDKDRCQLLKNIYDGMLKDHEIHSLKAFSVRAGIGLKYLTEIFNFERKISPHIAYRISSRLKMRTREKNVFMEIVEEESIKRIEKRENRRKLIIDEVSSSRFEDIELKLDHILVLSLLKNPFFYSSLNFISEKLFLPKDEVLAILMDLEASGFVEKENEIYKRTTNRLHLTEDQDSFKILKIHRELLDVAKKATYLNDEDVDFSMLAAITTPKKIKTAKKMISVFLKDLEKFLSEGAGSELTTVSIQLIPSNQKIDQRIMID